MLKECTAEEFLILSDMKHRKMQDASCRVGELHAGILAPAVSNFELQAFFHVIPHCFFWT